MGVRSGRKIRTFRRIGTTLVVLFLGVAGFWSTAPAQVGSCDSACNGPCTVLLLRRGTCQANNGQCACVPNTPAPGECALACDGRPCVTHCSDGTIVDGFCTALTVDTGCACSATCGTPSPTPAAPTGICCQTPAGSGWQCTTLSPFSNEAYEFCLAVGVPYLDPPFGCSQETGMCEVVAAATPTPTPSVPPAPTPTAQCASKPCGGTCVSCPFCPPGEICNGPPCLVGTCEVVSGSCACVAGTVTPVPSPTPVATPPPCTGEVCGGPCALCPPCTPGTICPEIACRLGTCAVVSGSCTCVAGIFTPGPSPTPTLPAGFTPVPCLGDCDGDGRVTLGELILSVGTALGSVPLDACPVFEECNSECAPGPIPATPRVPQVRMDCVIRAVNNALDGCPPPRCSSDQDCSDGNPCTIDRCTVNGCVNTCACR